MEDETLVKALSEFGLSEKAINTYLVVLERGEAKMSIIADQADVSKRYAYDTAETLAERGFVEVDDHSVPTTVRAVPPEEVIGGLTGRLESIESTLSTRYTDAGEPESDFEVIKSRTTTLKRIDELLAAAENEVELSLPATVLPQFTDRLRSLINDGVLVLLLVSGAESGQLFLDGKYDDIATITHVWSEHMAVMVTVDDTSALTCSSETITSSQSDEPAAALTQELITPSMTGSFLANFWAATDEVDHVPPGDLPIDSTCFRRIIVETLLHRRTGTTVEACVTGTPVATDSDVETETITGVVRDVKQALLQPVTNDFPIQNTVVLQTVDGVVSVGGPGAFVEDFEAERIELRAAERS